MCGSGACVGGACWGAELDFAWDASRCTAGGIEPLRRLEKVLMRRSGVGRDAGGSRDWTTQLWEAKQSELLSHALPHTQPRSLQPHDTTLGEHAALAGGSVLLGM